MYKLQIRWIKTTARNAMERNNNNLEDALTDLRKRKASCEPEWHQPFAHMFASELYAHAANWLVNPELVENLMIEEGGIEDRMFNRWSDDVKGWKHQRYYFNKYVHGLPDDNFVFDYQDRLTYKQAQVVLNRLEAHHDGLFAPLD
jgi:hypothetical protein